MGRGFIAGVIVVGLIGVGALANVLNLDGSSDDSVRFVTSASGGATAAGALPGASPTSHKAKAKKAPTATRTSKPTRTHRKPVTAPVVKKTTRTKPPTRTTKPAPPQRRIVTPGAFCKDAEAGEVGYSRTGHRYICSYYPRSDRYRWKRA